MSFCEQYELVPLPAELNTILLYLAYLAQTRSYVTIINYLSAVWTLHKMNDVPHIDPSSFAITRTLRGIHRTIGDSKKQAQLVTVHDLRLMFATLDMDSSEDVAFWLAIILCFRGLLRKSNVVEPGMAIRLSDVQFTPWGVLISVVRSKTISFKERVLRIPFNIAPG